MLGTDFAYALKNCDLDTVISGLDWQYPTNEGFSGVTYTHAVVKIRNKIAACVAWAQSLRKSPISFAHIVASNNNLIGGGFH